MTKLKKFTKITLLILGAILLLLLAAVLIFAKPLAMSVYNDNFGKRFTSYEPLAWNIKDFDGLLRDKYTFPSDKDQMLTGYKYYRTNTEPKGLVVISHGFGGGGQRWYMNIADYFASNGDSPPPSGLAKGQDGGIPIGPVCEKGAGVVVGRACAAKHRQPRGMSQRAGKRRGHRALLSDTRP